MERVIRVCEVTGRVSVVADNLTHDEAVAMVVELSKSDSFAMYSRVVKR